MQTDQLEPENFTPKDLDEAGVIDKINDWLEHDFNRARDTETQAINEFEKTLWLANSGAATITIGFLTNANKPNSYLFTGSTLFVLAIVMLLLMKLCAEINASRDRNRRQEHTSRFYSENKPLSYLGEIRDLWYYVFKNLYQILKYGSALMFTFGCALTLVGVYPFIKT